MASFKVQIVQLKTKIDWYHFKSQWFNLKDIWKIKNTKMNIWSYSTHIYIVNKMQQFKTAEEKPLKTEADYL